MIYISRNLEQTHSVRVPLWIRQMPLEMRFSWNYVYHLQSTVYNAYRDGNSLEITSTFYSLHSTVYSLQSTAYSVQSTVYSLQSTVYSLQSTVYSLQSTVYSLHYKVPV